MSDNETIEEIAKKPSKKLLQIKTLEKQIVQAVRDGKTGLVHKLKDALKNLIKGVK